MYTSLSNVIWNVGLLALGLPAKEFPQHEGWLLRHARWLILTAALLFAAIDLWLLRRRAKLAYLIAVSTLQLAAIACLWLVRFPDAKTTLPLVLRFDPDFGQATLALVVLAGWSVARVLLSILAPRFY